MNKLLFTNMDTTTASSIRVKSFLANAKNALTWDSDIDKIEKTENGFHITRLGRALNNSEEIKVIEEDNKIIYQSTGGRLTYNIEFLLKHVDDRTQISQNVFISENTNLQAPISFLKPIAKHAFSIKLARMAAIADNLPE